MSGENGKADAAAVRAARFVFGAVGFGVAAWAAQIPSVKFALGIEEHVLGLLLLLVGVGATVSMPLAGNLAGRFGCRTILYICFPVYFIGLTTAMLAGEPWVLAINLLVLGVAVGFLDVVMNIQAVSIEAAEGRSMMSGFHGMYSLGSILGAAGTGLLLGFGLTPPVTTALIAALNCLLMVCVFGRHFSTRRTSQNTTHVFVMPRGPVLVLGVLCFILYMNEGVIMDWGALFMTGAHGLSTAYAAQTFAVFSLTLTIGRLFGDRITILFGAERVLVCGGIVAALGYLVVLLATSAWGALAGFAIIGLGASNLIPLLLSLSSRQKVMPVNLAVAATTTLGFLGVLAGPALMGFVAHVTSLYAVFGIVLVLMLVVSLVASTLKR